MNAACTLAAIGTLLGFPVARGDVVAVPASLVAQHSRIEVAAAKACLRRLHLRVRVVPAR